jgi:hypothetical protein
MRRAGDPDPAEVRKHGIRLMGRRRSEQVPPEWQSNAHSAYDQIYSLLSVHVGMKQLSAARTRCNGRAPVALAF